MKLKIETKDCWYLEEVPETADFFESVCASLLRKGLFTEDERGLIWYPPHEIQAVRLFDEDEDET